MTPTSEQTAIIAAAKAGENCFVNALAGTAKTTTLILVATEALPQGGLALAFNVRIKKELEDRFSQNWTVLTLNGLGHRAWGKAISRRCEVDQRKLGRLTSAVAKNVSSEDWSTIRELVSKAMLAGLVPSTHPHRGLVPDTQEAWMDIADEAWLPVNERLISLAREVLIASVKESFSGIISYDDQIYMPTIYNGSFPRFPRVLVDEAQDLSALNHIQLAKSAADQLVVVGDIHQAIYAFRGASSNSMDRIRALRKTWTNLTLSTTFRCPVKIVERQLHHAPGYNAFETNPEGQVLIQSRKKLRLGETLWGKWPTAEELEVEPDLKPSWTWQAIRDLGFTDIGVISRNNAQIIAMAFKLLRQSIGCRMLGRDIGKNLNTLSKKLLPQDATPTSECFTIITEWQETQVALARANSHEEKVAGIVDRAESLLAVLSGSEAATAGQLRQALAVLFSRETGSVVLSTGHRAKGLEYDLVLLLDPWRIPSRWAYRAAEEGNLAPMEQEKNLLYVIETRARHVLIHANLEGFT